MSFEERLEALERRLTEIEAEWSEPEIATDPDRQRKLGREQAQISPVVDKYRQWRDTRTQLERARHDRDSESDPEIHEMANQIVDELERRETDLMAELRVLLLPRDPNDDKNVIVEIRAAAGGEESALFAAQLFRMYQRYAERRRWQTELISANDTGIGGMREAIFEVRGQGAYSRLKYEGGVHRVQRVPETESSGRIHTSTATVAVLPEADEVEVQIDDKDLRIDVYRSQGPGGQSVNTTDSAVRIVHVPTGLEVRCQDERSQLKNKEKALKILRSRLYEKQRQEADAKRAEERRSQIGSAERSDKIRTYNFPQSRLTDHRIGLTVHNLAAILEGDIDEVIQALATDHQRAQLAAQ